MRALGLALQIARGGCSLIHVDQDIRVLGNAGEVFFGSHFGALQGAVNGRPVKEAAQDKSRVEPEF